VPENKQVKCPVCGERFELEEDLKAGDTIYCMYCDHELKVVRRDPPKVKKLVDYPEVYANNYSNRYRNSYEDNEDYDDYEEDYEEMSDETREDIY